MATGTVICGDQLTANESAQLMPGGGTIPVTPDGTMRITWSSYGEYGYGLRLVHGPVLTVLSHAEFCSVTDEPPWAAVRGERIIRARVHWLDVTWGEQETSGPVALSLRFAEHRRRDRVRILDRGTGARLPDRR